MFQRMFCNEQCEEFAHKKTTTAIAKANTAKKVEVAKKKKTKNQDKAGRIGKKTFGIKSVCSCLKVLYLNYLNLSNHLL